MGLLRSGLWVLILAALLLTQTSYREDTYGIDTHLLGIDVRDGELLATYDDHGGFLGDGLTVTVMSFPEGDLDKQLQGHDLWKATPQPAQVTEVLEKLILPLIDETDIPFQTSVQNGYYCFVDRQGDGSDPAGIWDRASYNFTVALYDSDAGRLYYVQFDT